MEITILILILAIVCLIVFIISESSRQDSEVEYYKHKLELAQKTLSNERATHSLNTGNRT